MNQEGKPIGDKWNFDKDNRKGIKQLQSDIPERKKLVPDQITFDAMVDVEECFPNSIGTLENFNWATTHEEAENLLDDFIERYLLKSSIFLSLSVLSIKPSPYVDRILAVSAILSPP